MFGKTKLCKFHILGVCSKGASCNFAHSADDLNELPDLSKTKVCKTLINTGRCDDPECRYAHNRDELRDMPEGQPSCKADVAPSTTPIGFPMMPNLAFAPPMGQTSRLDPPVMPNLAFAQAMGQTSQLDPPAQAAALQQLAAQLSLQASMIQASQGNGKTWYAAPVFVCDPPAPVSINDPLRVADVKREVKGVPVDLASLTLGPQKPQAQPCQGGTLDAKQKTHVTIKNTFLDVDDQSRSPMGFSNQRRIQSAAGGLNLLGGESPWNSAKGDFTPPSEPAKLPTNFLSDPASVHVTSLFDSSKNPSKSPHGSLPTRRSGWTADLPSLEEGEEASPSRRERVDSFGFDGDRRPSAEKRLQDTPLRPAHGITVKNTFLDVHTPKMNVGMRQVQTYSGSLCRMTDLDDEDE